ncbi:WD40-repeat-containing domain protein [Leucosporidium creatinivorum]|uniref:WD40-repeat-containing domain protein n=1 Tax=Leucosporidium creatinivorum TaxID=106004 RepID=A0A1Y2D628_9BASI|nr:WD40-repeat-containing domain protein [Leucosporidium creatinivorum]
MDSSGLPLAFGRPQPVKNTQASSARIDSTKRQEPISTAPTINLSDPNIALEAPRRAPPSDDEEQLEEEQAALAETSSVDQREGADLPVSHEVIMKDHTKTVSALSIDPSGSRLVSGSYDYDCKLWDFGGMSSSFKPFRSWECKEGHQIHDAQFSPSGNAILVACGTDQAKLFDRDGLETAEFKKGDVYIRDLRHTDGHVAAITSVAWNHKNPTLFLTASEDSTLRIWEISNKRKSKSVIVVKSKERGGRSKVTACAWSMDGKWIAAACEDGAIHVWSASSTFARPNASAEKAHEKGTITSSLVFSTDGRQLASRGGDGTVKLWDTRTLKKPLFTATDLPSLNAETNLVFSPDERYILTGTAGAQAGVLAGTADEEKLREATSATGRGGKVVVLRREGLEVVRSLDISPASVVRVLWHEKINQILTGSADGSIHVLYSPLTSLKGVTTAVTRAPRARAPDDFSSATALDRPIITPHSLPMFKDEGGDGNRVGKRKRERERHDPQKTMKPMPPIVGPGRGGRVGAAATQHMVQGLVQDGMRDQDPREALLKYATKDVKDNEWTAAWTANQPKPVFDMRPDPDEEQKK